MEMQEWKYGIIDKATRQITYRNNMSKSDIQELTMVLSDYLEEGMSILKKWRKLKDESEFVGGIHDSGLVSFLKNKYSANGRELYSGYSSGGVSSTMDKSPESVLKSTCKQVI